ncbi:hypothetical protein [Actinospica sp.]|uniref:hypothetical protein n=1 Tax=Actinospica sp. TaxID=1872142 RepID=UPI002CB6FFE2|nr:hypothetical protein [Actinospica sp.]HWG26981.1 hypothetical protein [Actinospica sp.]
MTASRTMRQVVDMAKGKSLAIKGRAAGKRWMELRGEIKQTGAEARFGAHRFARRLRRLAHR